MHVVSLCQIRALIVTWDFEGGTDLSVHCQPRLSNGWLIPVTLPIRVPIRVDLGIVMNSNESANPWLYPSQ
jgi:hypothetical protein